jgi:hypothetical protein
MKTLPLIQFFSISEKLDFWTYSLLKPDESTAVAASGFRIKTEVDVFPAVVCLLALLMTGKMLPETC